MTKVDPKWSKRGKTSYWENNVCNNRADRPISDKRWLIRGMQTAIKYKLLNPCLTIKVRNSPTPLICLCCPTLNSMDIPNPFQQTDRIHFMIVRKVPSTLKKAKKRVSKDWTNPRKRKHRTKGEIQRKAKFSKRAQMPKSQWRKNQSL